MGLFGKVGFSHIHCLLHGAGLIGEGRFMRVRRLGPVLRLQAAFRGQLRENFRVYYWQVTRAIT